MERRKYELAERFAAMPADRQQAFLQTLRQQSLDFSRLPIVPARSGRDSLSYAQSRQWFLWQLDPESTAYHVAGALRLRGVLDEAALRASFAALMARHESLRTVFRAEGSGQPVQLVQASVEPALEVIDLSAAADGELRAVQEAARIAHAPFDLGQGPLLRLGLIRLGPSEHLLVVVMHHIVSDGWSMQVIVDEFVAHYRARVLGETTKLAPLAIQYADYAQWQRSWLEAGEKERQLAYWKQQLGSDHPVLQLPADRPRRADGRYSAARLLLQLPAALVQQLQQRAQAEGATLFMVLLAVFQGLLHRYTGLRDIRVGVPIANRHRPETEGLVGFFVNTQVLRSVVEARASLRQLLAQVKQAALGAQAHQDLPFEQLVEALQPQRSLGQQPLFQVMFNHQRDDLRALQQLPALQLQPHELPAQAAQFELTLDTTETPDGQLHAGFSYAAELFEPSTIERLARHYQAMLQAVARQSELPLADVPLLDEAERAQLRRWGVNEQRYPDAEPVHRLIERQVKQTPQATALVLGEEELSYEELNRRANRLAHRLIALGVRPEQRVGIALERSIEMVVGLLAILKAGGAYVPLDPEYPTERLAYMVQDSGIALMLTHSAVRQRIPAGEQLTVLELDALDLSGEPNHDPQIPLHGEHLAYAIYTSGSTGRPKGIGITHAALAEHSQIAVGYFALTPADRMLQFSTINFDGFVEQLFPPLVAGAAVVLRGPQLWDSETFYRELIDRRISIADLPTAYWHLLAQDFARRGPRDYGALRQVQATGEAMPPDGVKAWREAGLAHVKLLNTYGPTETVVTATAQDCRPYLAGEQALPAHLPIGQPLAGRHLWVLDAGLSPVPPGVAGELYIGGSLLARGYHDRAALSAQRFVADPFDASGGRLYRTGDIARWNVRGQLEYLGRADHQVKLRGFRIELGEIEAQLLAQPGVREAVVVAHEGEGGTRLVAYASGSQLDDRRLKAALSEALPDYMVPAALVVLPALPKNASGKIDRHALPAPEFGEERGYEPPQGALEQQLAIIWAHLLRVQRVGRHDNFFELGGHSLLALTLLQRLRAQGLVVPVRSLFEQPELAAFAQAVSGQQVRREVPVPANGIPAGCHAIEPAMLTLVDLDAAEIGRIAATVPGGAVNIQDIYPLAPLQEGILFHHVLQAGGDAYLTPHLLRFDSRARLEGFVADLDRVIARHDILRTAVLWEGLRQPVQVVYRHAPLRLQWLAQEDDSGDTARRLWRETRPDRHRMDVRRAPMLQALAAHDAAQDRWLLLLASHHLVDDHTTLDLIVEEIALIGQGRAHELPVPVPFRRFVAQARLAVSAAEHEAFFTRMLADVEEPTAPFGLLDVQGDGSAVEEACMPLAPQLCTLLRRQAQRHGVSAATLFHLAWALVLAQATGKDDVVFGTVLFGRMQGGEGAERGLGLFINTLPVRIRLGAQPLVECLRQTQQSLASLLHHEHASLALAQRCSGLAGGVPLFSALLNYRYSRPAQAAAVQLNGVEVLQSEERTNYPVMMSVDDLGEGFSLVAQAVRCAGAQRLCDWMQAALVAVAESLESRPDRLACELALLGEPQVRQLLHWGEGTRRYPDVEPVHRMIERQVRRAPEAAALVFGETVLSYFELNRRANQLAHRLMALGVRAEVRVGIAVQRSVEMVIGLLAILKAGGAYVPLDPEHPAQRLASMAADSGISLLLTQAHLRQGLPVAPDLGTLDLDGLDLESEPAHDPRVEMHAGQLAYVLYTSGSTGRPKGIAMPHGVVSQLIAWQLERLPGALRTLLFASPCFDVAFQEVASGLSAGGTLVQTREEERRDFALLLQQVSRQSVERLFLPFAVLQRFAESAISLRIALPRLREVITAGEQLKLTRPLVDWLPREPQCRLVNQYGPTESHVVSDFLVERDAGTELPPIGGPASSAHLRVLDRHLQPVPPGVPGELYIGSSVLARGYLQRPGLTAERFVADPFDVRGGRLYRTGDLVRWNDAGALEYLGRIDHQVKVRGFRVELGEIEAQLLAQAGVREAVVVARPAAGSVRLVAYVSGQAVQPPVLRERLAALLPDYMVPSVIVVLQQLPLNPNGKVDRRALPEPEFASGGTHEAPQGQAEEALAALWAEVLGAARVGRHDNFFELGGHSLAAMELAALARQRHGIELPLRTVFEAPTLAQLAAAEAVRGQWGQDRSPQLAAIDALLAEME